MVARGTALSPDPACPGASAIGQQSTPGRGVSCGYGFVVIAIISWTKTFALARLAGQSMGLSTHLVVIDARSGQHERSGDDLACRLVGTDDDPGTRGRAFDVTASGSCAFGFQAPGLQASGGMTPLRNMKQP